MKLITLKVQGLGGNDLDLLILFIESIYIETTKMEIFIATNKEALINANCQVV